MKPSLTVLCAGFPALFILAAQLQPADLRQRPGVSVRSTVPFNDGWLHSRGEIPGDAAKVPSFRDDAWSEVQLPHSPKPFSLRPEWKLKTEGIDWYRRCFRLPESMRGHKVYIEFEGADQVADVWINGIHLLKHSGAFLPFTGDVTDFLQFGDSLNVLAVKVNSLPDRDIPVYGNWISSGGLYRDVLLSVTDRLHITDAVHADKPAGGGVFATTLLAADSMAEVRVRTHVMNEHPRPARCTVRSTLIDADGRPAAAAEDFRLIGAGEDCTFDQKIRLSRPRLWHPNHPHLYNLRSDVFDGERPADLRQTRFGVRQIGFSRDGGFTINNERFVFMGTNRVQEVPYLGWAFPNAAQKRDALLLKEGGFQYVRCSHNPPDPSFLDACDELGLLVMDCIPGFQYVGGDAFKALSFRNMRDMIRRDRNHPSVILWELSLNESDFDSGFAEAAVRIGREEFPDGPGFTAGWKFPSIYDVFIQASQHGARQYRGEAPLVISEYGHWDYQRAGSNTSDVDRQDGEAAMLAQAKNHVESLDANRALPFLCGDGLWVGMDFQRYPSGPVDYFRIPKYSYHFFQSQRDPDLFLPGIDSGPVVFIANWWTGKSPKTVTVFSNCDQVDLVLNGRLVASQKPDTGSSVRHLLHPPFNFTEIPGQAGEIRAVGYRYGKRVAEHVRRTPGEGKALKLGSNLKGPSEASGQDLFFAYASVVDQNGTVVPDVLTKVRFVVAGPGVLIGPQEVRTEAGIAAAMVRTTGRPGAIVINAEADGLDRAAMKVTVKQANGASEYGRHKPDTGNAAVIESGLTCAMRITEWFCRS